MQDENSGQKAPAPTVWHYTTFGGLEGILKGTIWATSSAYLNDAQEFKLAVDICEQLIGSALTPTTLGSPLRQEESDWMWRGVHGRNTFIASFSARPDDLSQWRAYGGKGPSFAVEFDGVELERLAANENFSFDKVTYGEGIARRELEARLAPDIECLIRSRIASSRQNALEDALALAIVITNVAAKYKHEKFEDEREWRLIGFFPHSSLGPTFRKKTPLHFRQSGSLVVPYIEFPLHKRTTPASADEIAISSPIKAVVVGPSPHPDLLREAVREMVENAGLLSVKVTSSEVPFRNW